MRRVTIVIIVLVLIISFAIGIVVGGMAGGTHRDPALAWTPPAAVSTPRASTPVASPIPPLP